MTSKPTLEANTLNLQYKYQRAIVTSTILTATIATAAFSLGHISLPKHICGKASFIYISTIITSGAGAIAAGVYGYTRAGSSTNKSARIHAIDTIFSIAGVILGGAAGAIVGGIGSTCLVASSVLYQLSNYEFSELIDPNYLKSALNLLLASNGNQELVFNIIKIVANF